MIKSFGYAIRGLLLSLREERNLRIHFAASGWVIWLAWLAGTTPGERAALAVCCGLVICGELFNTAVEATVDLLSPHYHQLARRAKDVAAAGVLAGAFFAVVTGLLLFLPKAKLLVTIFAAFTLSDWLLTAAAAGISVCFVVFLPRLFPKYEGENS
ncbi:MAG: diacylglycerol kinase family protein [Angelakisella sp.]